MDLKNFSFSNISNNQSSRISICQSIANCSHQGFDQVHINFKSDNLVDISNETHKDNLLEVSVGNWIDDAEILLQEASLNQRLSKIIHEIQQVDNCGWILQKDFIFPELIKQTLKAMSFCSKLIET